jgi:hypothetical protein
MKAVGGVLLIITGLSVGVWLFFNSYSMRLDREDTLVVVLICTLLVLAGRWVWSRAQKFWR